MQNGFNPEQSQVPDPEEQQAYQDARAKERAAKRKEVVGEEVAESIGQELSEVDEILSQRDELIGSASTKTERVSEESERPHESLRHLKEQLGDEKLAQLESEAFSRLRTSLTRIRQLEEIRDDLENSIADIIQKTHENDDLKESSTVWQQINDIQEEVENTQKAIEVESRSNPEAFLGHWLWKLRDYKQQFEEDGIIETPGIKEQSEEVLQDIKRKLEDTNGVATLIGPTGSGKTVLAKKTAEALSPNGEYEFTSAHSKMTPEDLLFRTGITIEDTDPEDVPELIEEAKNAYREKHPDASEEELAEQEAAIEEVITRQASEKTFRTSTVAESVARAAQSGSIVVIDEFNYLPPETLASLNNLLATTPGKQGSITVGDKTEEFVVEEGFGVIFTGNVGEEYIGRNQELDPALFSRIASGVVEYSYPPQEINGSRKDNILSNEEISIGVDEDGNEYVETEREVPQRDLFTVGLVQLLDDKAYLNNAPKDALDELWTFSQTFSLIQQKAAGKNFRELGIDNPQLQQSVSEFEFESFFLSFREFNQTIREWKLNGYDKPLDEYVFENIIRPGSVLAEQEAAQMYFLFDKFGGMFDGQRWEDIEVNTTSWKLSGLDSIPPTPESGSNESEHTDFSPKEIVESVSGMETPAYEDLDPERAARTEEMRNQEELLAEVEQTLEEMERELEEESFVLDLCEELNS